MHGNHVLEKTDYQGFAQLRAKNKDVSLLRRKMAGSDQRFSDIGVGTKRTGLNSSKSNKMHRRVKSDLMHAQAHVFERQSLTSSMMSMVDTQ